uniref:AlNc14C52G4064 protein n=1 Tax=Albugo laibachii Nc14 TaxID=890382 RepID=F0WBL9_9STRA|nr:AlNc14C52G4064 [Albugo laibachii Nc14]|eukprot:CCA18546.1 AlNc14C52G4064 [Albugo laibachii Nc14]
MYHRLQVFLLLFFTFVAFASDAWILWATLVIFLSMLFLADLLFMDASQFKYNPDYKNWARSVDPRY